MRTLFGACLLALALVTNPAVAQNVSFSDTLPEDPTLSEGIALWPSVAVRSGLAFAIPSDPSAPTYIGPLGWSLGVDAKLNLGHAFAVGIRYMVTSFGRNDGSAGRDEPIPAHHLYLQYVYDAMVSHEILAFGELPFVNTARLRWSALLGVGVGIERVEMQQYSARDMDGDGIPEDKPKPRQLVNRQDTGPAFALGTTLEVFPVDFLSISAGAQIAYRYSPNLSFEEGALTLQGLFGVEGHF
ncbi:MAG: hypothetical protein ABIK09_21000 [Pseudomonadota bacterium]